MIPILYLIGKVLLTAILLVSSVGLLILTFKSFAIKRTLKQIEDIAIEKIEKDLNMVHVVSNLLVNTIVKKATPVAFVSPRWFKVLAKYSPLANKVPNLDELYSPVRSIIHSAMEIKNKLRRVRK